MSNLDGFITHKQPLPEPLATSAEIQDRQSTFLAYVFRASTPEQARRAHSHVRSVIHAKHPASHEIMAWRCMVLKEGRTGLRGDDDFKIEEGCEDDGELRAGGHVLGVMRSEAIMDAVVIVSRWYGGIMLGPVRFTHIQDCAREVCKVFRVEDEMQDCVSMLQSLDDILADLRSELANTKGASSPQNGDSKSEARSHPTKDYSALRKSLDVAKARRQISAREKSIESVKKLINEKHLSARATPGQSFTVLCRCKGSRLIHLFASFIKALQPGDVENARATMGALWHVYLWSHCSTKRSEMETARKGEADGSVHVFDALYVLVGRGGAGSQKPTVLSQETAMTTHGRGEERWRVRKT